MAEDQDWKRLDDLFVAALDLPAEQRGKFLDENCPEPDLRGRVERLLSHAERDSDTLESGGAFAGTLGLSLVQPQESDATEQSEIGDYRLIDKLGEGGMGEVWEAEQLRPVRRRVAIKLIGMGMTSERVIARFESERQALALMNHPNIAKVFDAGATPNGRPYFVMELVRGVPITDYCDEHRLDTTARLELLRTVCAAVHHAHMKAIIHRDLKPSNVLVAEVDGQPVPKVIDFGVAKAMAQPLTERTMYTELGQVIGTPEYMSPEQADLTHHDVDVRTDVYALGVLLYQLLTGQLPFDSAELRRAGFDEVLRRIREQDPPRPSTRLSSLGHDAAEAASRRGTQTRTLVRSLRGELDWIAMKALEKQRSRRYDSANQLSDDIQRYLSGRPVLAGPPDLRYRLGKFITRHRLPVTAAALVLLAALGAIVGTSLGLVRAQRAERVAAAEAAKATAINDFLQETLGSADPYLRLGRDVTVVEALEDAAVRADVAFAEQPEIRAAIQDTIGWTYQRLGRDDEARPLLQAALETRSSLPGSERDVATSASHLGHVLRRAGELEEAETLFRQALDIRRRELGEPSEGVAESLHDLGWLYQDQGKFDDAEALFREALEMARKLYPELSLEIAEVTEGLAAALGNKGDYEAAEALYRDSIELRRSLHGNSHLLVASTQNSLGLLLRNRGDNASSRELLEEALEIRRSNLGDEHPDVADSMNALGAVLISSGDLDAAEELYLELIDIYRRLHGERHTMVARSIHNLASVLTSKRELTRAETRLREALDMNRELLEQGHPVIGLTLYNLANVLLLQRTRPDEAETVAKESVEILAGSLPENHWRLAIAKSVWGQALLDLGRFDEAEPLVLEAHPLIETARGKTTASTRESLARVVRLYEQTGRDELAEPYRQQYRDRFESDG